jgi:peroxiredoxin
MGLKGGMKAPDFTLPDSQGNNVKLSNFKGKNVILYFIFLPEGQCTSSIIR